MKIITNLRGQTSLIQHTSSMYIYRSFHIHANRSIHVFSDYPSFIQNIVYHLSPNKISQYHHYNHQGLSMQISQILFWGHRSRKRYDTHPWRHPPESCMDIFIIDKMNCMPQAFINACTLKGIQPPKAIMQMQASESLVSPQLLAYMHLCCVADQVQPNKPCRE